MKIAILGAGMVGRTMAIDLCRNPKQTNPKPIKGLSHEVTSFDISQKSLDILKAKEPLVNTVLADLSDHASYGAMLADFDFVITAVPEVRVKVTKRFSFPS